VHSSRHWRLVRVWIRHPWVPLSTQLWIIRAADALLDYDTGLRLFHHSYWPAICCDLVMLPILRGLRLALRTALPNGICITS
jgi:hypothetical protein